VDIRPAARGIKLFENRDPIALRAKPDCRRQPAKATADHDGMRPGRVGKRTFHRIIVCVSFS
jgi:hypothetical protein